jgi:hypothetical protein
VDVGFAPGDGKRGKDRMDDRLRMVFAGRRPNTSLVFAPKIATVRDFIQHLETSSSVTLPVGDILIGSHANSEGKLFIPMFREPGGVDDHRSIDQAVCRAA